ncbi:RNA polymerase sigma-70 factor (ECF subfamily) [Pedobacter sp. AK017]|uniref:RNA polymerase sigma factor n=1 Tax=Pedobacter sp. AK017 TaxID=2723073 RepID=UPI00160D2061|nr:RNA polymerase sigma-70 factor [Pedobacter sp. AK017]MBB5440067.1 RNA polymerase sigma-70 factor (ECF subfamily) [Pedobacter sp. AK017]
MAGYSTYTDLELTALLKAKDRAAFEETFIRYEPLLLNFTYKKINNRDEAKDILQDIFVQLWNNLDGLNISSLSSYLYTAALNKIRDRYKHQVIHDEHIGKLQQLIDGAAAGADYLIREKDITLLIEKEIAALPEKMREVFLLRKNAFLSNKEIAEKLGIAEQTVETHMKRALKTLKNRLGPAVVLTFLFLN